ncbi:MAG: hypothetical protein ACI9Z3_002272, partial [Roseivirga sp.]
MTHRTTKILLLTVIGFAFFGLSHSAYAYSFWQQDTTKTASDTTKYQKTSFPNFGLQYRFGDPLTSRKLKSPLLFNSPSFLNQKFSLDTGKSLVYSERFGDRVINPPTI